MATYIELLLPYPSFYIPTLDKCAICLRFCPIIFRKEPKQNDSEKELLDLPYSMVFAIGTSDSVFIYSTDSIQPKFAITNIHYLPISDLSWMGDELLAISSSDGYITLTADEMENGDLSGKILIQKLTLKDPGFMTQALTLLGILDAFLGNDIVFDEVEIPVTLNIQNGLMIQDGYASGRNLGLTFQGKIDDNQFDLKGSLVPAYAINSLPGKIPFVGWLFKNSEGGGLVNVPFSISGSLSDPQVTFHPLGTMRPGFLGNLF